jgi:hypothetical protein
MAGQRTKIAGTLYRNPFESAGYDSFWSVVLNPSSLKGTAAR